MTSRSRPERKCGGCGYWYTEYSFPVNDLCDDCEDLLSYSTGRREPQPAFPFSFPHEQCDEF